MKLATYRTAAEKLGVVDTEHSVVFDLAAAAQARGEANAAFASVLALIEAGAPALDAARDVVSASGSEQRFHTPLASANLLAPIPVPPQIRDFSVFPMHIRQAPRGMQRLLARRRGDEAAAQAAKVEENIPQAYLDRPIYYFTNRFSVAGPGATITWPRYSKVMDFELELGIVIGKGGENIPREHARSHIFGYTIFNDFSARDRQADEMGGRLGPTKGKSFNMGNALGPWIVTADEIPDPYALKMSVRVNGETWTNATPADHLHSFESMIAYVSEDETLHPGEIFGSGTMSNGCGLEMDRYLNDGDVIELEVEKIGVLKNRVVRRTT